MHTFNDNLKKNQDISESRGNQRNCFKTPVSKCEKMRRISLTVCMLNSLHITRHTVYMYRSRNITKNNSKNNSHVHSTLGWDNICKYDLRKLSMRLSRHIFYCTKRSVCVCTLNMYIYVNIYAYIYTQIHLEI